MSGKLYKTCFVPCCFNNSKTTPNKIYISIPHFEVIRKNWFAAVNREFEYSYKTSFYCCEDHFDLPVDVENYLKYRLMGGTFKIKEDVVPHIFTCLKHDPGACIFINSKKPELDDVTDDENSYSKDPSRSSASKDKNQQRCLQHKRNIGVQTESIKKKSKSVGVEFSQLLSNGTLHTRHDNGVKEQSRQPEVLSTVEANTEVVDVPSVITSKRKRSSIDARLDQICYTEEDDIHPQDKDEETCLKFAYIIGLKLRSYNGDMRCVAQERMMDILLNLDRKYYHKNVASAPTHPGHQPRSSSSTTSVSSSSATSKPIKHSHSTHAS